MLINIFPYPGKPKSPILQFFNFFFFISDFMAAFVSSKLDSYSLVIFADPMAYLNRISINATT